MLTAQDQGQVSPIGSFNRTSTIQNAKVKVQQLNYYLLKSPLATIAIGPFPLQELAAGYGEALGWENFRIDTSPDFDVTIEEPDPTVQYYPAFYQHPNAAQHYLFVPYPKPIFVKQLEAEGFTITKALISEEPIAFIGKWIITTQDNHVVLVDPNGFKWWRELKESETEEQAIAFIRQLLTFGNLDIKTVNSKFTIIDYALTRTLPRAKLKAVKASKAFIDNRFSYRYHFGNESLAVAARRIKGRAIALVRRTFSDLVQLGKNLWDLKFDCIEQLGAEGKLAFKDWLAEDFGGSKYLAEAAMKLAPWYESLDRKTQLLVSLNVHEWSIAALKELTKLTGKALTNLIILGKQTARQIKEFRVNHSPISPEEVNNLLAKYVTADGQPLSPEDAENIYEAARELTEGETITFGAFKQALEDLGCQKKLIEEPPGFLTLREMVIPIGKLTQEPAPGYPNRLILEPPDTYCNLPFPMPFESTAHLFEWWTREGEAYAQENPLPEDLQREILNSYRPADGDAAEVEQMLYKLRLPIEPEIEQLKRQLAEEREQREEAIKQAIAQTKHIYEQERALLVEKWEQERRERTAIEHQYQELQAAQLEIAQFENAPILSENEDNLQLSSYCFY